MTFEEVLDQAMAMLQRRGRLTYRTLKLHFQLDDEHLEALKDELITANAWRWMRTAVSWSGRVGRICHQTPLPRCSSRHSPLPPRR